MFLPQTLTGSVFVAQDNGEESRRARVLAILHDGLLAENAYPVELHGDGMITFSASLGSLRSQWAPVYGFDGGMVKLSAHDGGLYADYRLDTKYVSRIYLGFLVWLTVLFMGGIIWTGIHAPLDWLSLLTLLTLVIGLWIGVRVFSFRITQWRFAGWLPNCVQSSLKPAKGHVS